MVTQLKNRNKLVCYLRSLEIWTNSLLPLLPIIHPTCYPNKLLEHTLFFSASQLCIYLISSICWILLIHQDPTIFSMKLSLMSIEPCLYILIIHTKLCLVIWYICIFWGLWLIHTTTCDKTGGLWIRGWSCCNSVLRCCHWNLMLKVKGLATEHMWITCRYRQQCGDGQGEWGVWGGGHRQRGVDGNICNSVNSK